MADIARILAEVVLQSKDAVAAWKAFGDAGVAEFKRVQQGAAQATAAVNKSLTQMQTRMQGISKGAESLGRSFASAGAKVSAGLGLPLTIVAKQAIDAFKEAQESTARLESTFAGLGKTAGFSLAEMKAFATESQASLAVTDEAVLDMQATLLKFGNIAPKQFEQARDAVIDYAQVSGQDLPSAAQAFGKALNDPLRGLRALREAGISFSKEQLAQIKLWQESGQTVKAQTLILDQFSKKYGQVAEDFAQTDTGKAVMSVNRLGDAMERLGQMLLPFQIQLTETIARLLESFLSLPQGVQQFIIWIGVLAIALGPILVALGGLISVIGSLAGALAFVLPFFAPLGGVMFTLGTAIGYIINIISIAAGAIAGVGLWPVIVAAALGALIVLVVTHWDQIVSVVKASIEAIANFFAGMWDGLTAAWNQLMNDWTVVWAEFLNSLAMGWDAFVNGIKATIDAIIGWLGGLVQKAKDAWEWVKKAASAGQSATAAAGGGGGGFARGGRVHGRGGIDNVAAWLTAGEFVHRVAAVRKYGAGFMHAVNNLSYPSALARGYAVGGVVASPRMAFARGGGVPRMGGGERGFTLVIDGQTFANLRAPADTANDLLRFGRERQIRAAGKAPSWFK